MGFLYLTPTHISSVLLGWCYVVGFIGATCDALTFCIALTVLTLLNTYQQEASGGAADTFGQRAFPDGCSAVANEAVAGSRALGTTGPGNDLFVVIPVAHRVRLEADWGLLWSQRRPKDAVRGPFASRFRHGE